MEAAIVPGLKRPGSERHVTNGAFGSLPDPRRVALRAAALAGEAVAWCRGMLGTLTGWAARRSVAPTSLAGVSVLLALCSAAWLSGGGGTYTIRGIVAVSGWYAMMFAARTLAANPTSRPRPQRQVIRRAAAPGNGTDWLVLPGMTWDEAEVPAEGRGAAAGRGEGRGVEAPARGRAATEGPAAAGLESAAGSGTNPEAVAGRPDAHDFQWLAAVCTVSAECAIYGGIAAGGHGAEEWPVAVMTIASVSLTETLVACRHGPLVRGQGEAGARGRGFWWVPDRLVAPSAGWRVLIAMVVLAAAGPGQALAAVFAVEAVSVCWVLVVVSFGLPTARFAAPAGIGVLARCRDDGPAARWAGRLVQGGLLPLQPAVAGLFATAMLAAIGLRSLPGFVAMTPPVVMMMLASPGSSHAHDGRADWLVPTLLAAAQYVYLAALGFADAVPGPVVFAACAVLALWQASLAAGGPPLTAAGIGWEGRMFGIGFAAIFGFATFGYIGQAAFLGLLTCQNILGRYLVPKEEGHARGGVLPPGPHRDHRRGDSRGRHPPVV